MTPRPDRYALSLGSNRASGGLFRPRDVLRAAIARLDGHGIAPLAVSEVYSSRPVGPSRRRFVNAAVIVETLLDPPALLDVLQDIERAFGRKAGRRWGARPIDIDIVLWDDRSARGGAWGSRALTIPHVSFRERPFVLRPLVAIAGGWRDPLSGRTVRQLKARLAKAAGAGAAVPVGKSRSEKPHFAPSPLDRGPPCL